MIDSLYDTRTKDHVEIPEKRVMMVPKGAIFPDGYEVEVIDEGHIIEKLARAIELKGNVAVVCDDVELGFVVQILAQLSVLDPQMLVDATGAEYSRIWFMYQTQMPTVTPDVLIEEVDYLADMRKPPSPARMHDGPLSMRVPRLSSQRERRMPDKSEKPSDEPSPSDLDDTAGADE